jgi:hypothetical protein
MVASGLPRFFAEKTFCERFPVSIDIGKSREEKGLGFIFGRENRYWEQKVSICA